MGGRIPISVLKDGVVFPMEILHGRVTTTTGGGWPHGYDDVWYCCYGILLLILLLHTFDRRRGFGSYREDHNNQDGDEKQRVHHCHCLRWL